MDGVFFNIGIVIIAATILAYATKLIRQPLIPAYIITGLILGPILGIVTNQETISALSEIGLAFLLFIVGLEISFNRLKYVALISTLGGIIQMILLFSIGFLIANVLGFINIEAVYIGLALSFSSTMVVVKLLSDKRELDTLHGRIVVGILLMEDFIAVIAISMFSTQSLAVSIIAISLVKAIVLLLTAFVSGKYILPIIFKFAAKTQELFFLVSIAVCFIFSLFAAYLAFSIIIGAFIAGIALANLPYNLEIISRVKSLKDFFSTIFFVSLGMKIFVPSLSRILVPLIVLSGFIILIKPIITMMLSSFFGYRKRPSFLSAISLAQIGEFSLIIVAQGFVLGHVSQDLLSLTVLLAVITMSMATYFINFDSTIYRVFAKPVSVFERLSMREHISEYIPKKSKIRVILCGHNRIGYSILKKLKQMRKKALVVDYNPEVIRDMIRKRIPCIYGDIGDLEIIERINLKEAEMMISTVPNITDNRLLIKKAKEKNPKIIIFVTTNQVEDALSFYEMGADYVIMPHFLGGDHASIMIEQVAGDFGTALKNKMNHIKELKRRHELGHTHPKHD